MSSQSGQCASLQIRVITLPTSSGCDEDLIRQAKDTLRAASRAICNCSTNVSHCTVLWKVLLVDFKLHEGRHSVLVEWIHSCTFMYKIALTQTSSKKWTVVDVSGLSFAFSQLHLFRIMFYCLSRHPNSLGKVGAFAFGHESTMRHLTLESISLKSWASYVLSYFECHYLWHTFMVKQQL